MKHTLTADVFEQGCKKYQKELALSEDMFKTKKKQKKGFAEHLPTCLQPLVFMDLRAYNQSHEGSLGRLLELKSAA